MNKPHSDTRPFAYGYTASSNSPRCGLPKSQGQRPDLPDLSGAYASVCPGGENPSSYPSGQQHPDGPGTPKNQKEALNFGWFSLPRAKQGCPSDEDRLRTPLATGGEPDDNNESKSNQRPSSKGEPRPSSQQKTPSRQGRDDLLDNAGMGEPAGQYEIDQAGYEHQDQGYKQNQPSQPIYDESIVIDWPLSVLAQGSARTSRNTPQTPNQARTPLARPVVHNEVPPTPLPPLLWQGYQNSPRPTYASWHEYWHHNRDLYPKGVDKDTNNSNSEVNESLTSSEVSSTSTMLGISSGFADSNNNNWLMIDDFGSSPGRQVTTLPPYEQSSPVISRFHSPNVVMKWDDADDQGSSEHENQGLKQIPFMKRIRSGFFHIWSVFSCLKSHRPAAVREGSRLFKYDRFDHGNNPLRGNQRSGQRSGRSSNRENDLCTQ